MLEKSVIAPSTPDVNAFWHSWIAATVESVCDVGNPSNALTQRGRFAEYCSAGAIAAISQDGISLSSKHFTQADACASCWELRCVGLVREKTIRCVIGDGGINDQPFAAGSVPVDAYKPRVLMAMPVFLPLISSAIALAASLSVSMAGTTWIMRSGVDLPRIRILTFGQQV